MLQTADEPACFCIVQHFQRFAPGFGDGAVARAHVIVADIDLARTQAVRQAEQLARVALGAYAKAEATARGVSGSLQFLALVTAGFGLVVALARALAPSPPVRPVTR